jgi:hypothetical protein
LAQHAVIAEDVATLAKKYEEHEREGEHALRAMQLEMQAALHELESCYYSSSYR